VSHVEKPERLFCTIAADMAILPSLLGAVREVKRSQILEEYVAAHGQAFVKDRP